MTEPARVEERYERRKSSKQASLYSMLDPYVYLSVQERERQLISLIETFRLGPIETKTVLEIGCGSGTNLLELIKLGFDPANLTGNELLPDRVAAARHRLPAATQILAGDAAELDLPPASCDIVYQSTVFTSLLDDGFQAKLADKMWSLVKPGGGILWYDFIYNNPNNPDVRGAPVKRVRERFPAGKMYFRRVTLAPPIGRAVTKIYPCLYHIFNALPFFRTHILAWIAKPR
jgi:SAM-dependent methyltransferase